MDAGFYDIFDISQGRCLLAEDQELIDRESNPGGVARLRQLMPNLLLTFISLRGHEIRGRTCAIEHSFRP